MDENGNPLQPAIAACGGIDGLYQAARRRFDWSDKHQQAGLVTAKDKARWLAVLYDDVNRSWARAVIEGDWPIAILTHREAGRILDEMRGALDEAKKEPAAPKSP